MKNEDLEDFYNSVAGSNDFFTFKHDNEARAIIHTAQPVRNKFILDLGCGTGGLTFQLAREGAKRVLGIDYSIASIEIAETTVVEHKISNAYFLHGNIQGGLVDYITEQADIIVAQGVIEHLDDPFKTLGRWVQKALKPYGKLIISVPYWANPRGCVMMTLQLMLGVPVTLADLHFFTRQDIFKFAQKNDLILMHHRTVDKAYSAGELCVKDFTKRFNSGIFKHNFKKVMGCDLDVKRLETFLKWFEDSEFGVTEGANIIYKFVKSPEGEQKA